MTPWGATPSPAGKLRSGSGVSSASAGGQGHERGPGGGGDGASGGGRGGKGGRIPLLLRAPAYFLLLGLVVAISYPLQAGRRWASPVFHAPGNLNIDAREWLAMAETTPFLSKAPAMRIARPLYPGPAFALRRLLSKEHSTLLIYRGLNVFWFLLAAWGLRRWTLYWTPYPGAALMAGLLFAASPFVQIFLWQPMPEMTGAAAAVWVLAIATWATGRKLGRPRPQAPPARFRPFPWVVAGVVSAILMLGKELYALYVCLALVGLYRRAWKPMLAFAFAAASVHLFYLAFVILGLQLPYRPYGANQHGFLSWLWEDFLRRPLRAQGMHLWRLALRIGWRTLQAFSFWPVAFALVGAFVVWFRPRWYEAAAYAIGFYALFLATNLVTPRICYLMFPAILPPAAAAIVWLGNRLGVHWGPRARAAWYVGIGIIMLAGLFIDPYRFYYYG